MALLITGIIFFTGFHLASAAAPQRFRRWQDTLGANRVKGIVAVGVLAGLVLIVLGWRASTPAWIYTPPPALRYPALLLVAIAIWLFVLSTRRSRLRRVLRHPQLLGVFLWASAHLLLNGDSRSLVLFASLAAWAVLEIGLINRRDGPYQPPPAPALTTDLVTAVMALVTLAVLAWAHPWLAGVPVI